MCGRRTMPGPEVSVPSHTDLYGRSSAFEEQAQEAAAQ